MVLLLDLLSVWVAPSVAQHHGTEMHASFRLDHKGRTSIMRSENVHTDGAVPHARHHRHFHRVYHRYPLQTHPRESAKLGAVSHHEFTRKHKSVKADAEMTEKIVTHATDMDGNYYIIADANQDCMNDTQPITDEGTCIKAQEAFSAGWTGLGMDDCPAGCTIQQQHLPMPAVGFQQHDGHSGMFHFCLKLCHKMLPAMMVKLSPSLHHEKQVKQVYNCPNGYYKEKGDTRPFWGDMELGSYWGARHAFSPEECGEQCGNTTGCASFKWSPHYLQGADPTQVCILSKEKHVTTNATFHDFIFCTTSQPGAPTTVDVSNPDDNSTDDGTAVGGAAGMATTDANSNGTTDVSVVSADGSR
jgi:hypothetical protein